MHDLEALVARKLAALPGDAAWRGDAAFVAKLRALALASTQRHPLVPDVPTTAEAGLPQLQVENWTAIMMPAATPDAVVQKLGAEVVRIMGTPELEERARTQGFRVDARGPDKFAPFLTEEIARWAKVIQAANIKAD